MAILIRTVPSTDDEFRAHVREALVDREPVTGGQLVVDDVDEVKAVARTIREAYPAAVFRRQHSLAAVDAFEVWYAYRDPDVFHDGGAD